MYTIKNKYCDQLLKLSGEDFPKRKTIEKYKNGSQKAQENSVRALESFLGVNNWRDLVKNH